MLRPCILLCLILMLGAGAQGQQTDSVQHWNTDNGMSSNGIRGLQFDTTTGFLWIATEAGLHRFNGLTFKSFESGSSRQVLTARMSSMTKNNAGHIYAIDQKGRLFTIVRETPVYFDSIRTQPDPSFCLSVSEPFYKHGVATWKGFAVNTSGDYDIVLSQTDTSCLLIHEKKLYSYSISSQKPVPIPLTINIHQGFMIGRLHFLLDAARGIQLYNTEKKITVKCESSFRLLPSDIIIWRNGMENPLLFSGNKAFVLRFTKGILERELISSEVPVNTNIQHAQYAEKIRTLFIGTESNGIYIIRHFSLEAVHAPASVIPQSEAYYAQVLLPNSNILTERGQQLGKNKMLADFPVKEFRWFTLREKDSLWYFRRVQEPNVPGANNLCLYCFTTHELKTFTKIRMPDQTIMVKSRDVLYMISPAGIFALQKDSAVLFDNRIVSPKLGVPFDVKEISPGVLAIAYCNYLLRYDIAHKKADTLLASPNGCIRTLWVYRDMVFAGTYGAGIFVSRNGVTKPLPLDRDKHLLFAHCFVPDSLGYCWISSNKGLYKVRLSDMVNAFEHDLPDIYYHYYGKEDGMVLTEMNGACSPCALEMQDRRLSFPTMSGLVWADPYRNLPWLGWKDIFIDEFLVNKHRLTQDSLNDISLPFPSRNIQLRISYPVWENAENIYIKYRMEEDTSWIWLDPHASGYIGLMNLGAGKHTLLIRKINGFGIDNYTDIRFVFKIQTPWYQTWPFYFAMAALGIGLMLLYLRIRTRQYIRRQRKLERLVAEKTKELQEQNLELEKRDALKSRLISIINHDIITPLRFLSVAARGLVEKKTIITEDAREETIAEMANASVALQALATNMLNWIKYHSEGRGMVMESFELHELTQKVLQVLSPAATQKRLLIISEVATGIKIHQYFEPLRILVYNIVSNAINFSEHGNISLTAVINKEMVTLTIADQGFGMTKAQVSDLLGGEPVIHPVNAGANKGNGLGYLIIRDLVKITGVSFAIESKPGIGTKVIIGFKTTDANNKLQSEGFNN